VRPEARPIRSSTRNSAPTNWGAWDRTGCSPNWAAGAWASCSAPRTRNSSGWSALEHLADGAGLVRWAEIDREKLAGAPLRNTLTSFYMVSEPTPKAWETLKQFPKLYYLNLKPGLGSDKELAKLPPLDGVGQMQVDLRGSGTITAAGWGGLLAGRGLVSLGITGGKLNAPTCEVIAGLPKLGSLALHDGTLDEGALRVLGTCPKLRALVLNNTTFPEAEVKHLAGLSGLESLDLTSPSVTDKSLEHLTKLTRLRKLNLRATKVTKEGVTKLSAALPRCEITWDGGTVPASDAEYRVARRLLAGGNSVYIELPNGSVVYLKTPAELPDGSFTVHQIDAPPSFSNEDLKQLEALTALRALNAVNARGISNDGLKSLVAVRKSLTGLILTSPLITDAGVKTIGELEALQTLRIYNTKLTDAGLEPLARLQNLTALSLEGVRGVDGPGLKHLAGLKKLTSLELRNTGVSAAAVDALSELKGLTTLDLRGARVNEAGYEKLRAALPKCKIEWGDPDRAVAEWVLTLSGGHIEIETDGQALLRISGPDGKLPAGRFRLKSIGLRGVELPPPGLVDTTLDGLRRVTDLHELTLVSSSITDAGLEKLTTFPGLLNLEYLALEGPKFGNGGLAHLKRFPKLNTIAVYGPVTGEGLTHLKAIPTLKRLLVSSADITDSDLAVLREWSLENLDLAGPKLTSAAAPHLAELGRLKWLFLQFPLEDADLRFLEKQTELTRLRLTLRSTGDGLRVLGNMKKLQYLYLGGPITDAGLEHLAALKSLTGIRLTMTKVTAAGVEKLQKALPKCKIDVIIEPTKKP
jgi:Leucine-rich repeat (LRR) protein